MNQFILSGLILLLMMTQANAQQTLGVSILTSDKFKVEKVAFDNQYNMKVVGNLMMPIGMVEGASYPAIIVGHPMGAVKEQSANIYGAKMAERGFITLTIDLPFWGESEGEPRNAVSTEMYADAFSAAVDYLGTQALVDRDRIGVIGICGSGSFAISAAKIDTRIKAITTISMYDMGAASRNGLGKSQSLKQRKTIIAQAAEQRSVEFSGGRTEYTGGTPLSINEDSDPIAKEFYDFYRTPRGAFTPKGATPHAVTRPTLTSNVKFINFYPFNDMDMISPRALLFVTGDEAHSKEFSEDAYQKASEPKELYYVKGAGHVDLYDRINLIPFDKLETFFSQYLK